LHCSFHRQRRSAENRCAPRCHAGQEFISMRRKHITSVSSIQDVEPTKLPLFVPSWVRGILALLRGAPISVLLAYASHADRDGLAFPSIGTLCRETGYGINSVKKGRALLIGMGMLIPLRQERERGQFGRKIFQVAWKASASSQGWGTSAAARSTEAPFIVDPSTAARKQCQEGSPTKGSSIKGDRAKV
jgi:hypothetical protein